MSEDLITDIIDALNELKEDTTVPKNIKLKISAITSTLSDNIDVQIKINKALNELDEISDDTNIQAYTRTQLWNIASMLEKV